MLCREVQNYISTAKGLPFFYVVGDEDYSSVLEELKQVDISIVRMSDFCFKDDKFPSVDELVDYFRTSDVDYRNNKFVVVGLGEYLALRGPAIAEKELRRLKNTTLGNARAILLLRVSATATTALMLNTTTSSTTAPTPPSARWPARPSLPPWSPRACPLTRASSVCR